jgi:hypothetical protein
MKRSEQMLIGVGIVVVAGSLWYALSPSGTGGKTNLVPLEQARVKTGASKANVRKLQDEKAALEPNVRARAYAKPSEQLVPVVVGNLQSAAERAGIHLREVRPLRPKLITDEMDPKAAPKATGARAARSSSAVHEVLGARVPVEVRFKAPFQPNVVKFLYDIENPAGKMVLDKISITSADAKFRTVEVSAQITVFTRSSVGTAGGDTGESTDESATKG